MKKLILTLILSLLTTGAFADLTPEQVATLRSLAQADPGGIDAAWVGTAADLAMPRRASRRR